MQTSVGTVEQRQDARRQTDLLFEILDPSAIYARPIGERHRTIFYIGHVEAFDWNQLWRLSAGRPSFHPEFDRLFEAGIDPPLGQLPADVPTDWPSREAVSDYVSHIREEIDRHWDEFPLIRRQMVIEHRHMHAETLAYMLHNLPHGAKVRNFADREVSVRESTQEWMPVPAGRATLGQDAARGEFGWDNEFNTTRVDVPAFRMQKFKVNNGDWLKFMEATGAPPPHFWVMNRGEWHFRGMFESIPLPLDWPVWSTLNQARKFAAWAGYALPTEAQYHRAAFGRPDGSEAEQVTPANCGYERWNPEPVNARPESASAFGVEQLVGNGWEWTQTPFAPLDGFAPHDYYPGYSANFFDDKHFVLKGGSPRTALNLTRRSLRNWFRPDYPYLYAGFRLVENPPR